MIDVTTSHEDEEFTEPFSVSVNNKPVEVDERLVTGLEIKALASVVSNRGRTE